MSRSRVPSNAPARRAVVRWAWRLVRRDRRQYTVIVVLMTVVVGATVLLSSAAYNLAAAEGNAEFGTASDILYLEGDLDEAEVSAWLAAGEDAFGTIEPIGISTVAIPGTTYNVDVRAQALGGPFSAPMLTLRDGRAPTAATEAAVTDGVADLLAVTVGDSIDLDDVVRTVVGVVENPSNLDDEFVLVPPSDIPRSESVRMLVAGGEPQFRAFGDVVGGIRVNQRSSVPEAVLAGILTLIASTILLVLVALIASASFTVIAQRRLPQLGMLSAIGGNERHIKLAVLASGTATGAVSAVVGGVAGVAAWLVLAPSMESMVNHRVDALNIPWLLVLAGMVLAVITATAAAWWPARVMARIPTVAALSGRTPQRTRPHRSVMLALALLAGGVALVNAGSRFGDTGPSAVETIELLVGMLAVIAGVLFLCPIVIRSLGRVARSLPISGRLALRDLSRRQARSSAALAAVALALGIPSVIVAAVAADANASPMGNLAANQILVHANDIDGPFVPSAERIAEAQVGVDAVVDAVGSEPAVRLDTFRDPTMPLEPKTDEAVTVSIARQVPDGWMHIDNVYAATPALLAALGLDVDAVADGEVVTSDDGDLFVFGLGGAPDPRQARGDPVELPASLPPTYTSLPSALLDPAEAAERGWEIVPSGLWLIEADEPLDRDTLDAAREVAARSGIEIETRDDHSDQERVRLVAGLVGMLLALGVLAATVGLIRGESANELRTLTAAGASPRIRRGITAVTAGALSVTGAALGIASAYIGLVAGGVDHLTPLPWRDLALIAFVTPVAATALAWLLAGREPAAIDRRPLD